MVRRSLFVLLMAVMMLVLVGACGDGGGGPSPAVLSVSIDQEDVVLDVGATTALSVRVEVVGGASDAVVWSSEDEAVATVSDEGVVTGVAVGEIGVIATSAVDGAVSDSITVTVSVAPVVSVSVEPSSVALVVGATQSFTALVTGASDTSVSWSATCGSISGMGSTVTYMAPGFKGACLVRATSVVDEDAWGEATVTVEGGGSDFEPDLVIDAQGVTYDPVGLGSLRVPANSERLVEVNYHSAPGADLMYFEVGGDGVAGAIWVELRTAAGEMIAASRSSELFGTDVRRLTVEGFAVQAGDVEPRSISIEFSCLGPCVAQPYRSGRFYAKLVNTSSVERNVTVYAYGLAATDVNEPNDTVAEATPVTLARDGDGAIGAIEHVADVDYFRFECAPEFGSSLRLELFSGFRGDIVLRAGGATYRPGELTAPLPCNSVVHVRTEDSTAGPSSASRYSLLAESVAVYELTVTAQGFTSSPSVLGSMSVPAGETRWVHVSFPSTGGADLRYVEVAGSGVDGSVRLESFDSGDLVGVSESQGLFAASTAALVALDGTLDPSAISVAWRCFGPCVAERYRSGVVELRVTNLSSSARTVDVYAYGMEERDENEPNDSEASASVVTLSARGDFASGAIERIGDVDYFRFQCGSGWPEDDITLRMSSGFAGGIVLRLADGSTYAPGETSRAIPCNSLVSVRTTDGTAGPSGASRYAIVAD